MNLLKLALITSATGLLLAGCETTSSRPYKASTDNILAFQSAVPAGTKVSIANFDAAAGVDTELTCRAMGALDVSPGKTPISFIQGALKEELFEAGVYAQDGNPISGRIDVLDADSWGTGGWKIDMNLSSPSLPDGYNVDVDYAFKSSYSAVKACQNVVDAYTPAVQALIAKAIEHPSFGKLISK